MRRFHRVSTGGRASTAIEKTLGSGRLAGLGMRDNGGVLTRPPAGSIPDTPGSYQFKDKDGRVIYVGKAKSLRSRLSNYFAAPGDAAARAPARW